MGRAWTVRQVGLRTVQQCGMLSAGHAANGSSMDGRILPMAALDVCRSAHPKLAFKKGSVVGWAHSPRSVGTNCLQFFLLITDWHLLVVSGDSGISYGCDAVRIRLS